MSDTEQTELTVEEKLDALCEEIKANKFRAAKAENMALEFMNGMRTMAEELHKMRVEMVRRCDHEPYMPNLDKGDKQPMLPIVVQDDNEDGTSKTRLALTICSKCWQLYKVAG